MQFAKDSSGGRVRSRPYRFKINLYPADKPQPEKLYPEPPELPEKLDPEKLIEGGEEDESGTDT